MGTARWLSGALLCCLLLVSSGPVIASQHDDSEAIVEPRLHRAEPVEVQAHDSAAFTQGFHLHEGIFYESTGRYGESSLRAVSGEGEVIRQVNLSNQTFGEGLARVGDELIQLTWRAGIAYRWNLTTFEALGNFSYEGEGWGLCNDGARLVMSNGSTDLTFRNESTFEVISNVTVTRSGVAVERLNELACIEGVVWANVWQTDEILVIDPDTGVVTDVVNASGLLSPEAAAEADVLNGITWNRSTGEVWLTGKNWPSMFRVELLPIADEMPDEVPDEVPGEVEEPSEEVAELSRGQNLLMGGMALLVLIIFPLVVERALRREQDGDGLKFKDGDHIVQGGGLEDE